MNYDLSKPKKMSLDFSGRYSLILHELAYIVIGLSYNCHNFLMIDRPRRNAVDMNLENQRHGFL